MRAGPSVSVVVPARAEAARIERCLEAVLNQDWPADLLEVIVVDGAPGDGTAVAAARVLAAHPDVRSVIVPNPGGGRSANLNRGLSAATGSIVCRVDARSAIPPGYVAVCAGALDDPAVAVVGGSQAAVAPGEGSQSAGIGRALNNRLAMGMARYRRSASSQPADTVYLGAFRRHQLQEIGGWAESLEINEDFDLNQRMRAFGSIWFDPRLVVTYLPRAEITEIAHQYWDFGRWKIRYLRSRQERPRVRQAVGLSVAPVALGLLVVAAASPRRLRLPLVAAAVTAALVAEEAGSGSGVARPSLRSRTWSVATCAAIGASWSAGGWWEIVAGGMSR